MPAVQSRPPSATNHEQQTPSYLTLNCLALSLTRSFPPQTIRSLVKEIATERKVELRSLSRIGIALIFLFLFLSVAAFAQKLPFQRFTSADGLSQDNVNKIVRDSRGFLWFCTGDGLSRFDGYRFKNYTQEQGLPHRSISDLLETRAGEYLIASSGGISLLNSRGKAVRWDVIAGRLESDSDSPLFRTFTPPEDQKVRSWMSVHSLAEHSDGSIYAATNNGLFRFVGEGSARQFERVAYPTWDDRIIVVNALFEDSRGLLWIATASGVYGMDRQGKIETIAEMGSNSVFEDGEGNVWIDSGGHDFGIRVYGSGTERPVLLKTFTKKDGLIYNSFSNAVAQSPSGTIFVASSNHLFEYHPEIGPGKPVFVEVDSGPILNGGSDSHGNLWFGTFGNGAMLLPANNISIFSRGQTATVSSMLIDRNGNVILVAAGSKMEVLRVGRLQPITPLGSPLRLWSDTFLDIHSANGEWWIPTEKGLYRYPAVKDVTDLANTPPKNIYAAADGLTGGIFNIFEDSRRDIWITSVGKPMCSSIRRMLCASCTRERSLSGSAVRGTQRSLHER